MLVLSRTLGESIVIALPDGRHVTVTPGRITRERGGTVRLRIDAPRHIIVDREEVHLAKRRAAAERRNDR